MRFTTLSLVLALYATFSVSTSTTVTASAIATATSNDNLPALSRRHLYPQQRRHVADTRLTDSVLSTSSQLLRSSSLSSSSLSPSGSGIILKRQKPRRLAGDKRGDGTGLLDKLVGELVPPKQAAEAPPSHDVETLMERDDDDDDGDEEEEDKEEQTDNTPEPEADEPQQEQDVIVKGDDEEQEHTLGDDGDQDPTDPSPEDITNPSPSDIIEPTDTGSDPEPSPTTSAEEPETTPAPEEDRGDKEEDKNEEGHGQEPDPTPTPDEAITTTEDQPEPTTKNDAAATTTDSLPEPTDPVVAATSTTTTTQNRPPSQLDPTTTKASKDKDVGPTMLPEHKEETNGNQMALTIGVIIAAIVIASVIGIWIFRKWKLSPSRQFKSKIAGGSGGAGVVYGTNGSSGQSDHSEYNSYDEIFRPEAYENGQPPMTSVMTSSPGVAAMAMPTPAYPPAVVVGHDTEEYNYGYASYEQQQQPLGNDNYHQHHHQQDYNQDYNHYGYDSRAPALMPMSEASAMRTSVVSNSAPPVVGGVQATGHNIHGYGSEDYTQNDHFLRELRE
ncbi:hypothetical protein EC991_010779 [Linnemannia zychae]|nr:hypothetical protein EC991_010779 [Linnemannia zychae]